MERQMMENYSLTGIGKIELGEKIKIGDPAYYKRGTDTLKTFPGKWFFKTFKNEDGENLIILRHEKQSEDFFNFTDYDNQIIYTAGMDTGTIIIYDEEKYETKEELENLKKLDYKEAFPIDSENFEEIFRAHVYPENKDGYKQMVNGISIFSGYGDGEAMVILETEGKEKRVNKICIIF